MKQEHEKLWHGQGIFRFIHKKIKDDDIIGNQICSIIFLLNALSYLEWIHFHIMPPNACCCQDGNCLWKYMHLNGPFMYRKDKNENVDACYDFN